MAEGLSIRAYARHRGVSHAAVQKAIASGRITTLPSGRIDPVRADQEWADSTDRAKPRNSVTGDPRAQRNPDGTRRAAVITEDRVGPRAGELPLDHPEQPAPVARPQGGGTTYAQAQAMRAAYQARLAKLEYEERSGRLIDRDEYRAHAFRRAREARDALFAIADRLAPLLAATTDEVVVHRMLTDELRRVCMRLAGMEPTAAPELQAPDAGAAGDAAGAEEAARLAAAAAAEPEFRPAKNPVKNMEESAPAPKAKRKRGAKKKGTGRGRSGS